MWWQSRFVIITSFFLYFKAEETFIRKLFKLYRLWNLTTVLWNDPASSMGRDGLSGALWSLFHVGSVWGTSLVPLHNSPWPFVLDYPQGAQDSVTLGSKGISIGFCKRKRIPAVLRGILFRPFLLFFESFLECFSMLLLLFYKIRVVDSLFQSGLKCEHRRSETTMTSLM